ncbi:DUF3540 domain-containing protein [Celerinatantimonas sp. MCCC 1A17872]|uniref:DUF3540 domain-containing protein n=1 Tax=Celerinatantimonas sp. MCCC 1A17872 TaxID=3177514 RepID=UPI0038C78DF9
MDNVARQHEILQPVLEYGFVTQSESGLKIDTDEGQLNAERAVSCLVRPQVGDKVLVSVDSQGMVWVLSILERTPQTQTVLETAGDTVLHVQNGGLTIAPDTNLTCVSPKASLSAAKAEVSVEHLSIVASVYLSQVERIKVVANTIESISQEFTRRVVNYFRFTKEHEECQAESHRQLVDETLAIQSKNTLILSDEDVKIDAELIHMG